jgi:hypothetical protein
VPDCSSTRSISALISPISSTAQKSILKGIDRQAVSTSAKAETRNREIALPPVSIYRWWARRTDAVNGAVLEAAVTALNRKKLRTADPFSGGGVIPLAALIRGHSIYAQDLDPWAVKGLRAALNLPQSEVLANARKALLERAKGLSEAAYGTMFSDGSPAMISQTLRVAVSSCGGCGHRHRLFPFALVSLRTRKDRKATEAIFACRHGHLFDGTVGRTKVCPDCCEEVDTEAKYLPDRAVTCPNCSHVEQLHERCAREPLAWEAVLVERTDGRSRRELAYPTQAELDKADDDKWRPRRKLGDIRDGPETRVLTRHGFRTWGDIYPRRQRVVTERLLSQARKIAPNEAIARSLEMAILGTVEMAGHLSRWDRFYLKAFEAMASHRFNFTTFTAEPNVIGAGASGRGTATRRLLAFERASAWFADKGLFEAEQATVVCGNSERIALADGCVDLVLTDPPYHDDVQYADLSLPFRAWAGLASGMIRREAVAIPHGTNLRQHRRYRHILTAIFEELNRILAPRGRLVFSYANREPAAWVNLFAALRAADFEPVAYTILQSENELDPWRKKGRACSLDLLLELSPKGVTLPEKSGTTAELKTVEESYLLAVGEAFLRTSQARRGWEEQLMQELGRHPFIAGIEKALEPRPESLAAE